MNNLWKFTVLQILFIVLGLLSSKGAFGADPQKLLEEALNKQQKLYQQIENQLADLSALEQASKDLLSSLDKKSARVKVVEFSVVPAYHDWPKEGHHSQTQDYDIELSFLVDEHNQKLTQQFDEWLAQGWFIQRSVTSQLSTISNTLLKVRLVR